MSKAFLELRSAGSAHRIELGGQPIILGRLPALAQSGGITLADDMVSKQHCVFEPSGGTDRWQVRDLGSKNGTRVNGELTKGAVVLRSGDEVLLGRTTVVLIADTPGLDDTAAGTPVDDVVPLDSPDVEDEEYIDPAGANSAEAAAHQVLNQRPAPTPPSAPRPGSSSNPSGPKLMAAGQMDTVPDDVEDHIRQMALGLPDTGFGEYDIALVNHRGGITHAASQDAATASRRQRGSGDIVDTLRLLLLLCARLRATDVHLEPKEAEYSLRIRVDGSMVDVVRMTKAAGVKLAALVKVLSDIDIAQRSAIQEGHFSSRLGERRVDYRISFTPAMFGQKLVMRILDAGGAPMHVWDLRMPAWMQSEIEKAIRAESGMLLVCGPTGSGKTTTLYSALRSIDTHQRNVVTIEDPVEIQLDSVTQIPVDEKQGNTFPALLRSLLRQDPDAIMIGEIRDAETARIAMQAAITGHLVFSSLHTRDTLGTVYRLIDLGVEPYMLSQGLQVVVAQRLVKQLCPHCKRPTKPMEHHLRRLTSLAKPPEQIFNAVGCPRCLNTGYAGRRAVFELLVTSQEFRDGIQSGATMAELRKMISSNSFVTLQQSAAHLVAEGATSMEEVDRAVGA